MHFLCQTDVDTFCGNFWRKLGYFLLQHLVTLPRQQQETLANLWFYDRLSREHSLTL